MTIKSLYMYVCSCSIIEKSSRRIDRCRPVACRGRRRSGCRCSSRSRGRGHRGIGHRCVGTWKYFGVRISHHDCVEHIHLTDGRTTTVFGSTNGFVTGHFNPHAHRDFQLITRVTRQPHGHFFFSFRSRRPPNFIEEPLSGRT